MKGVLYHQDSARAHKSGVAMAAVHDCGFELVDHPPYSPDLAPSDYFLFPNMKKTLGWETVMCSLRLYSSAFLGEQYRVMPSQTICQGSSLCEYSSTLV